MKTIADTKAPFAATQPLHYLDATALAELIRTKRITSKEVVQAHLDRIESVNPKINAIVTLMADAALKSADAADRAVASGAELGPLHGVPFTVKDSIDTAGVLTQRGSPIFKGRIPATDAVSVARLKAAGGILLAKTNLPVWPRVPRRFWHVGPMARSVRDIALAYSLMAGPDGVDGFASSTVQFDAGVGSSPVRPLRVGWLVEPGFGPIDPEVAATVQVAAEALKGAGCVVDQVRIPALERDFALAVFNSLHVMEMKPAFAEATAGHRDDELYMMAKTMLATPDTSMADYIEAEQAAERLRDGFADYFQSYDALLTPVQPIPAHKHGVSEFIINGQTVDATYLQGSTVPLNVTGLPGLTIRFGTSRDGLPIGVQLVSSWLAESTILHLASLLEMASPVRDLHPNI